MQNKILTGIQGKRKIVQYYDVPHISAHQGCMLNQLQSLKIKKFDLKNLMPLDHIESFPVHSLLGYRDPKILMNDFGFDIISWLIYISGLDQISNPLLNYLKNEYGFEKGLLYATIHLMKYVFSLENLCKEHIILNYLLMKIIEDVNNLCQKGLSSELHKSIIQNRVKNKTLSKFTLTCLKPIDYEIKSQVGMKEREYSYITTNDFRPNVYLDAPHCIGLLYKNIPVSIIGIVFENMNTIKIIQSQKVMQVRVQNLLHESDIVICQSVANELFDYRFFNIYLVKHISNLLNNSSFEPTIQKIMDTFNIKFGINELIVQSGENNYWTKKIHQEGPKINMPHLSIKNARNIYDEPASVLGFSKSEIDKNFHLSLR